MLARVKSGALMGVDAVVVEVEVDMSLGMPFFNVVGLPEGAVKVPEDSVKVPLRVSVVPAVKVPADCVKEPLLPLVP